MSMPTFIKDYGHVISDAQLSSSSGSTATVDGIHYEISSVNRSLVTSLLSLGTLIGALSGGWVTDRFGRKHTLSIGSAVFMSAFILQMISFVFIS